MVATTLRLVGLYTEMVLSPWLAIKTLPPLGNWTMGPGLMPRHTVLETTRLAVLITLNEPVRGQTEVVPEFETYIKFVAEAARPTGRDPGYNPMLMTAGVEIRVNSLTVSLSRLATKIAPATEPWKACATDPRPVDTTCRLVSPETSI